MNRKFKRKAEKEGVPHTVTFPNLVTGDDCAVIVVWDENFTPTLTFVDGNHLVYAVPALDFMESVGKLTREALDRFKKTLTEK